MNLRTGIVSLLALGLLAWFLRGTNFADVWIQVRQVRPSLLVLSVLMVWVTFIARTIVSSSLVSARVTSGSGRAK